MIDTFFGSVYLVDEFILPNIYDTSNVFTFRLKHYKMKKV